MVSCLKLNATNILLLKSIWSHTDTNNTRVWKKVDLLLVVKSRILHAFCMPCVSLIILLYCNDNQRIELVNWCILIFIIIFSLISFSLWDRWVRARSWLRFFFSSALFFESILKARARAHLPSECMQWEHAINVNMIWNANTRSYQAKCVYNWNDLPKMHGQRAHVKIRLQARASNASELPTMHEGYSKVYLSMCVYGCLCIYGYVDKRGERKRVCVCLFVYLCIYKLWFIGTVFLFVT